MGEEGRAEGEDSEEEGVRKWGRGREWTIYMQPCPSWVVTIIMNAVA